MATRTQREEVPASEVKVGDLIFFPSSRKPQEVTDVYEPENVQQPTVVLSGVRQQWHLRPENIVARQIQVETNEEATDG